MIVKGNIDEIRFRNEDNGYTILVLDVGGEPLVAVGNLPPLVEGEEVEIDGEMTMHAKFGKQIKIKTIKSVQPDTLDGIVRYLGSGLIKGVGPKTALSIVSRFREKTLEVLEFYPYELTKIKGISKEKAAGIGADYDRVKKMRDAVIYLQSKNITLNLAIKIFKQYGENTVSIVKNNPYKLVEEIEGVGFLTADRIAKEIGIEPDSEFRICAGILYSLVNSGERSGNTFLPDEELIKESENLLQTDAALISDNIDNLVIAGKLRRVETEGGVSGVMLTVTYRTERAAAVKLVSLKERSNKICILGGGEIAEFERNEKISLHIMQKKAVECAVNNGVAVITGGPGTGKTTIIKCILSILDAHKMSYSLMAPTGRAAKRLSDSTAKEASTIHRALMLNQDFGGNGEPVNSDAVIVDEVSMVDIFLLNNLLSRLREGTKLILIGDKDQLPSVGAGNVLADIKDSGYVPVVNLTEVYRQSEQSLITLNAHAINRGEMPKLDNVTSDFFFVKGADAQKIAELTVDLACERIPKYINADVSKVQVLSPMKNGAAGTINLNNLLQARQNGGAGAEVINDEQKFKEGDRVMHTANNYNLQWTRRNGFFVENGEGVFNGDVGYITGIRIQSGEIDVAFEDGREATYTQDIRGQLILAYAITVHKSQGSEFDAVIVPVYGGNPMILTRNLLYTAITRAKKIVVLVGEEYNIKRMVDNNYIARRYSMLKTFIGEEREKYGNLFS